MTSFFLNQTGDEFFINFESIISDFSEISTDVLNENDLPSLKQGVKVLANQNFIPKSVNEQIIYWVGLENWKACIDLGESGLPELKKYLGEPEIGNQIARVFGKIGPQSIPYLMESLNSSNKITRKNTVYALGILQSRRMITNLIHLLLNDEDEEVRAEVALALSKIGSQEASMALIEALNDENPIVRKYVIVALGKSGYIKAVQPLLNSYKNEEIPYLRRTIQLSLRELIGEESKQLIQKVVELQDKSKKKNKEKKKTKLFSLKK